MNTPSACCAPRWTCPPAAITRELVLPQQRAAVWVADITYVETGEGWLFVAGVLDRCTRRCVGWARAAIFEWIEVFYNRERLHSALGFKSPVDFETSLN